MVHIAYTGESLILPNVTNAFQRLNPSPASLSIGPKIPQFCDLHKPRTNTALLQALAAMQTATAVFLNGDPQPHLLACIINALCQRSFRLLLAAEIL